MLFRGLVDEDFDPRPSTSSQWSGLTYLHHLNDDLEFSKLCSRLLQRTKCNNFMENKYECTWGICNIQEVTLREVQCRQMQAPRLPLQSALGRAPARQETSSAEPSCKKRTSLPYATRIKCLMNLLFPTFMPQTYSGFKFSTNRF